VKELLYNYIIQLADSSLILAQQNGTWCGHGPILEQDIAITNITLDLLGQARNYYQYAADLRNELGNTDEHTEDSLAYLRGEREFRNLLLCEQPNGDWAQTIARQFFYSVYLEILYTDLSKSQDERLAGIAAKSLKEIHYHSTWCTDWMCRLGDGTAESKERLEKAVAELWPFTGEMFIPSNIEKKLVAESFLPEFETMKKLWFQKVEAVFLEATLPMPDKNSFMQQGGKEGVHTEKMGFILAEMQYLQRVFPGATW
jgi:ring-1,2-phenylacetyl-CoA epoxidase subunit PaaC